MGGARATVAGMLLGEVLVVLTLSVSLAALLTGVTAWYGAEWIIQLLAA